jgi:hypothetical protein
MPDITMCQVGDCPRKDKCYRSIAQPNYGSQSYFVDDPRKDSWHMPNTCEYFIAVEVDVPVKVLSQVSSGSFGFGPVVGAPGTMITRHSIEQICREVMDPTRWTHDFPTALANNRVIRYKVPFLSKLRNRWFKLIGVRPPNQERKSILSWCLFMFLAGGWFYFCAAEMSKWGR